MTEKQFSARLLEWSKGIERDLPWKESKDPYQIWLSEIILQQTRVAQGRPYYLKFIEAFPSVQDLAAASQDEVFSLWEGLGYYSRARNLHATAKMIVDDFEGIFPKKYTDILSLKGVGPYTAAAIASFAYDLPHAVVDGNVIRVLSRIFGIDTAFDTSKGKKIFQAKADELLLPNQAAEYNQAIMDFGATQCKPKSPNCQECPMADDCLAFKGDLVSILPFKSKKLTKRDRFFHFIHIIDDRGIEIIQQRLQKDIWQDLYQYPLIEKPSLEALPNDEILATLNHEFGIEGKVLGGSKIYKQTLSHQYIHAIFYKIEVKGHLDLDKQGFYLADRQNVSNFAFPRIIRTYLEDKALTLF